MAMVGYNDGMMLRSATTLQAEPKQETAIWEEAGAWLALLPVLFITSGGRIETDTGPVAFRFTAMEEDSFSRRVVRLGCELLVLFLISTRARSIFAACTKSKLILLLPALALASAFWSQNPQHTVVDSLNLLLTTLFAIYIYQRYPGDRLVSFLTFAAFLSLLLCVLTVTLFPSVGIDGNQQDAWRGIFGQKNNCATACTLFLAVALHAKSRGVIEQMIRGSVILLSLVFIVMSASRTGWIVAAFAVVFTYSLRFVVRFRSLERILFLMLMAVPAGLVAFFIGTHFNAVLAAMDKDPTLTQRTIIWAQVLPSILKQPFLGYGYSAFWQGLRGESITAVLTTGWMEGQAQDGYLDILLGLGLFGLVPLAFVFLRGLVQTLKIVEKRLLQPAIMMAIVLIPLILIENVGESSLLVPLGIPWFYALTSLLTLNLAESHAEEI